MTDAAIGIAVFLEDHKAFDHVPLSPPGSTVNTPQKLTTYWLGQTAFKDGVSQETCRNFQHVGYSPAATAHVAEAAWHQGVDLYGEVEDRSRGGTRPPRPLPVQRVRARLAVRRQRGPHLGPDLEVALDHLENRLHVPVPAAHKLAEETRPAGNPGTSHPADGVQ